jgi:RNA polymerase sigma-70 factor (ECF subfamily)
MPQSQRPRRYFRPRSFLIRCTSPVPSSFCLPCIGRTDIREPSHQDHHAQRGERKPRAHRVSERTPRQICDRTWRCHKTSSATVLTYVDGRSGTLLGVTFNEATLTYDARVDLETLFYAQYKRLCRVIARVIRDPARAEELAVDVLLKWRGRPEAHGENAEGWLYRTASREALDELRRQLSRAKYERLFAFLRVRTSQVDPPTPEDIRAVKADQEAVRQVLAALKRNQAQLLVLRSEGFTYDELASALHLNPVSVGTLLARAQRAFRKEYVKRYGQA